MLHTNRVWCVSPVASIEELTQKLSEMSWCGCTGFELDGYLFLNDSTSPDAIQEFAFVKRNGDDFRQVETITTSWCDQDQLLGYIRRTLAGEFDQSAFSHRLSLTIESPEQHGRCQHCG